ncbi:unnamed protein product [Lota lota]
MCRQGSHPGPEQQVVTLAEDGSDGRPPAPSPSGSALGPTGHVSGLTHRGSGIHPLVKDKQVAWNQTILLKMVTMDCLPASLPDKADGRTKDPWMPACEPGGQARRRLDMVPGNLTSDRMTAP